MCNIALLLQLCEQYAAARQLSLSRVSTLVFNDGKIISKLQKGADITVGRLEAAVKWLDANWPDDQPWPQGQPRPSLIADAKNVEAA